jgi:hypothetical protein
MNNKRRITPRHILLAVRNDAECDELPKNVIIPSGGSYPYIVSFSMRQRENVDRGGGYNRLEKIIPKNCITAAG